MQETGSSVERLYQDESLTSDVDDVAAKALLRWGEQQLAAGRPEEQVRQGLRALNKVIARRAGLDRAAARARLEAAGLSVDETALANLLREAQTEADWAGRLAGLAVGQAVAATPAASSAPAPADEEKGVRREGEPVRWWHFWRRRP